MSFEKFDEWFAVCDPDDDTIFYPGRLIFDPTAGIKLLTVDQSTFGSTRFSELLNAPVINGLLDYQRPTVLLNNFVTTTSHGSLGINTRYMRQSYVVVVNQIIQNIHLKDINEEVFLDLRLALPSFKAWLAWKMISNNIEEIFDNDRVNVNFSNPFSFMHQFQNGVKIEVYAFANKIASNSEVNYDFLPSTSLNLSFPQPLPYDKIDNIVRNIDNCFNFLIGCRMQIGSVSMLTNLEVTWNKSNEKIVADSYFMPAWNRQNTPPYISERMFIAENTPVSLADVIGICLNEDYADVIYWMSLVTSYLMRDLSTDSYFFEIIGSLENVDIRLHGAKIGGKSVHLEKRLARLIAPWSADGFRGMPNLREIVSLRNKKAHGRSFCFTMKEIQKLSVYNQFFAGLMVYHILKVCGFSAEDIARGLARSPHRFGFLVPKKFIP